MDHFPLLAPDEGGGGAGPAVTQPPAQAEPAPQPAPEQAPQPAPQAQPELTGLRQAYAQIDPQLAQQAADDQQLLAYLQRQRQEFDQYRQAAEQYRQVQPYVQQYLQHAGGFQQYLAEQQAKARAEAARQGQQPWYSQWWNPPEYDQSWERLVVADPQTGELKPAPGAPPDVVPKYLNYVNFRRQTAEKFMNNPYEFIRDPVVHLARQEAERAVQQALRGFQETQYANGWVQQNADWLWAQDPATGQRQLSEWGQRFAGYVQQAQRDGLQSVEAQQQYALAQVQRDYAVARLAALNGGQPQQQPQQQPLPPGEAAKRNFLAAAGRLPNSGGSLQTPNPNGTNPQQNSGLSLADRLRRGFQEAGYQPGQVLPVGQPA